MILRGVHKVGALTASSDARLLPSSRLTASGSISFTKPSLFAWPDRRDCMTLCLVNFQYPVVASGCCGAGAVSCSHSRITMSSERSGEAFMIACARVDVGVYGLSCSRLCGELYVGCSVFRALVRVAIRWHAKWMKLNYERHHSLKKSPCVFFQTQNVQFFLRCSPISELFEICYSSMRYVQNDAKDIEYVENSLVTTYLPQSGRKSSFWVEQAS